VEERYEIVLGGCSPDAVETGFVRLEHLILGMHLETPEAECVHPRDFGLGILQIRVHRTERNDALTRHAGSPLVDGPHLSGLVATGCTTETPTSDRSIVSSRPFTVPS
jgi:hypothetical protein